MEISKTPIEGLLIFQPRIFTDNRGSFQESFNERLFTEATGQDFRFVQDNQSVSMKGVLRGLHLQHPPHAQGKLVRVARGAVIDVAVDIRKSSPTYGQYVAVELSEENNKQLWIPPGFAHGFAVLEDDTIFAYKCTDYYAPECEETIMWNDPDLNIDWKIRPSLVSEKDEKGTEFRKFVSRFD